MGTGLETSCTNGDVRLWNGVGLPANEGLAQMCHDNTWYSICSDGYCDTAKVLCKSLGYAGLAGKHRIIIFNSKHFT